jgi:hypothetical protein
LNSLKLQQKMILILKILLNLPQLYMTQTSPLNNLDKLLPLLKTVI